VDTFTYTASDGLGGNTTETLSFSIDRPPTAVNDAATVLAGGTVSKSTKPTGVLGNDTDPDADTLSVSAVNGSAGNVGTSIATTYGHLNLKSDGTYTYLADNAAAIAGVTGSHPQDVINYTASDGLGGTSSAQLTVTIERPPVLNNVPATLAYTEGGTPVQLSAFFPTAGALTISDPDGVLITRATATLGGFFTGDLLTADTTGLNISQSFAGGVLTLSGSDTAADYQHVLESIKFSSTSANPTNYGNDNSRTLSLAGDRRRQPDGLRLNHHQRHGGGQCAGQHAAGDITAGQRGGDDLNHRFVGERCRRRPGESEPRGHAVGPARRAEHFHERAQWHHRSPDHRRRQQFQLDYDHRHPECHQRHAGRR
jgi:VCBS repeat-containing protein